ncbi:MAG: hypothetical protein SR1Q5_02655, partial [Quinella sp. 1Q5]|nr:hypothetical protein [Quinella sp. 1Q5]
MNSDKKLLKTSVAAEFLCVPHRTFQRWVKEGKLIPDFVSDGGHNFFSEETLSRFKIDVQNQNAPLQNAPLTPQNAPLGSQNAPLTPQN